VEALTSGTHRSFGHGWDYIAGAHGKIGRAADRKPAAALRLRRVVASLTGALVH
jgi:hypothetical protein